MHRSQGLNAQLDAYCAAVKPLTENGAARLANWSVYAMATGSALAMATSANAGIIYSGPLNLTASIPLGLPNSASIKLKTGPFANSSHSRGFNNINFRVFGFSYSHARILGLAAFSDQRNVLNASGNLKRLAFGAMISQSGLGSIFGAGVLRYKYLTNNPHFASHGTLSYGTWPNGVIGYAGFKLSGSGDFGWLKLSWSGANGFPDAINLYGWAVQTDGTPILAGAGSPEPGTFGLALLAAGAAGVRAWRRRKQPAAG